MLTPPEKAYIAGILDGEGCITMFTMQNCGGRPATVARVFIGVCSKDLIPWLKVKTGNGNVFSRKAPNPNWKDVATIMWQGKHAAAMLRDVLPYLMVKRRQAEIVIDWVETQRQARHHIGGRGRKTYPQRILSKRDRLLTEMRRLNQRGTTPTAE